MSQILGLFQAVQTLIATISSIFPYEVFWLLAFSLLILPVMNLVFFGLPRVSYTVSVSLVSLVWYYLWQSAFPDPSLGKVIKAALYLLVPVHFVFLCDLVWRGFRFYQKKRKRNGASIAENLMEIQRNYHNFMSLNLQNHSESPNLVEEAYWDFLRNLKEFGSRMGFQDQERMK